VLFGTQVFSCRSGAELFRGNNSPCELRGARSGLMAETCATAIRSELHILGSLARFPLQKSGQTCVKDLANFSSQVLGGSNLQEEALEVIWEYAGNLDPEISFLKYPISAYIDYWLLEDALTGDGFKRYWIMWRTLCAILESRRYKQITVIDPTPAELAAIHDLMNSSLTTELKVSPTWSVKGYFKYQTILQFSSFEHFGRTIKGWIRRKARNAMRPFCEPIEKSRTDVMVLTYDRYWTGKTDYFVGELCEALKEDGMRVVVLDRDLSVRGLGIRGVWQRRGYSVPVECFQNSAVIRKWLHRGREISRAAINAWMSANSNAPKYLTDRVIRFFRDVFRDLLIYIGQLDHAFQLHKPRTFVLSGEGSLYGRGMVALAKSLGIVTVGLQHGLIHANHPGYLNRSAPYPDIMCVYGTQEQALLKGLDDIRLVVVTGDLKVGKNLLVDHKMVSEMCTGRYTVFISQPLDNIEKLFEDFLEACRIAHQHHIAIKLHPNDRRRYRVPRDVEVWGRNLPIEDVLRLSQKVVVYSSTVALEALAVGCDVIVYDPDPGSINPLLSDIRTRGLRVMTVKELARELLKPATSSCVDAKERPLDQVVEVIKETL